MSSPRKANSASSRVPTLPLTSPPIRPPKRPPVASDASDGFSKSKKKKAKTNHSSTKSGGSSGTATRQTIMAELSYEPLTLADIQTQMLELCQRVPPALDADDDDLTHEQIVKWANQMQCVLEGFNLLLSCVSPATYIWSTKRSGAADQHLSVLSSELQLAQEAISSMVSPRLSNLLAPVVDVVVDTITTTTKPDEERGSSTDKPASRGETKIQKHTYTSRVVDPDYLKLSGEVAKRNSPMLRHVLLATILKSHQCITDYAQAVKDEEGRSTNMGYSY